MAITWNDLTFTPDADAIDELATSWAWLIPDAFTPILFTVLGDMFFQPDEGGIWWLNTGTAELTQVADSVEQFNALLRTELAEEWLIPELIGDLHDAGKIPAPGECYTYITLPVFAEGTYEVDNLHAVPAIEHFALTGQLLEQLQAPEDDADA
jgi:Domain of unknown function (DUF1851)